jgi:hypothetical protein
MVPGVLAQGRAAFLRRMRDTCVIVRPGLPVDDGQGGVVDTPTSVYEGACYVRYPGFAFESNREVVGAAVAQSRVVIRVPFGPVFRPGDRITIIASPDTPHLAGTVLRVASVDDQSQATAQRLLCEDNQAGVAT